MRAWRPKWVVFPRRRVQKADPSPEERAAGMIGSSYYFFRPAIGSSSLIIETTETLRMAILSARRSQASKRQNDFMAIAFCNEAGSKRSYHAVQLETMRTALNNAPLNRLCTAAASKL